VDNVTDDHDAGLGSSAEDMETHNPDIADYDKAIADMDADDDDTDDSSGGTIKTDEPVVDDADASDADKDDDKGDDKDEDRIPKSRLDEVIAQRDTKNQELTDMRVDFARKEAIFEGRLAALEKPEEKVVVEDPFDKVLEGEPQTILDAFTEDPAGFVRQIKAQARVETAAEINEQREHERYDTALQDSLNKFTADHDDFMPNAEKLVKAMDASPIHNVISAYYEEIAIPSLTSQLEEATTGVEEKVAEAKAAGIVEGKKLAIKEIQVKQGATVLDGSSASQSGGKANVGLETGGDRTDLVEKITANLLKSRGE
jgi:hypothetical protein